MAGEVKQVAEQEEITDQMQEQLSQYLVGIFRESLNSRSAAQAGGLIRIVNELESIGDSCGNCQNIAAAGCSPGQPSPFRVSMLTGWPAAAGSYQP